MAEQTGISQRELYESGVDAARRGERSRARDIFTRLLRYNQEDENVWLWMSSVVESDRERIFCLNKVLELSSENETAMRGLALLGALPEELRARLNIETVGVGEGGAAASGEGEKKKRRFRLPIPRLRFRRSRKLETVLIGVLAIVILGGLGLVVFKRELVINLVGAIGLLPPEQIAEALGTEMPGSETPEASGTPGPSATPGPSPTPTATARPPVATAFFDRDNPDNVPAIEQVMGISLPLTPTPAPTSLNKFYSQADSLIQLGIDSYEAGDFEAAREDFNNALAANPEAATARYYLGLMYMDEGNYFGALSEFNRAVELDVELAPAYLMRGLANEAIGNIPLGHFEDAALADPTWGEPYAQIARYFNQREDYESAFEFLAEGLAIAPENVNLLRWQAITLLATGDPDGALEQIDAAIAIDPTAIDAYLTRGQVYLALEAWSDAQYDLNLYVAYRPDDGAGWGALGQALANLEQSDEAIEAITVAIELDGELPEHLLTRASLLYGQGDLDAAAADYIQVENLTNSFEARFELGKILFEQERYSEAAAQFDSAILIEEADAETRFETRYLLGMSHLNVGVPSASVDALSLALNEASTDMEQAQALIARAQAYLLFSQPLYDSSLADLAALDDLKLAGDEGDELLGQAEAILEGIYAEIGTPTPSPDEDTSDLEVEETSEPDTGDDATDTDISPTEGAPDA